MNNTSFDEIFSIFLDKVKKDKKFFNYFNVSIEESLTLAKQQSKYYLFESISKLTLMCQPDVDFNDYNESLNVFNFKLTLQEINILANLMFEVHLNRDTALLGITKNYLSSEDIKILFSPANERRTFTQLLNDVRLENEKLIYKYASRDRLTGKRKTIDHSQYEL